MLDRAAAALAPIVFEAEPVRPALGPCSGAAGAGCRRLLANRYATFEPEGGDPEECSDPRDGELAAAARGAADFVARVWQDLGLVVRRLDHGSLGHEVTAIASGAGTLVFGAAAGGMTLGGETACVPAGAGGQVTADERSGGVAEDISERQGSLADLTQANDAFRRVVVTGPLMQLAVMTIPPGGEVGEEIHQDTDQFLFFVEGQADAWLDGERFAVPDGGYVFVPAGTRHNFVNAGDGPLRIATTYAPAEHPPATLHQTKADADADEHG